MRARRRARRQQARLHRPARQRSDRAKTMKLVNNSARLLAGLAVSFCLVSGSWAQTAPAKKTMHKKSSAPAAAKAAPDAGAAATPKIAEVGKRDPFLPLVNSSKPGGTGGGDGSGHWNGQLAQWHAGGGSESGPARIFPSRRRQVI